VPDIFLDLDGVCCDFAGAAAAACGHPTHRIDKWDFFSDFGMTVDEFWKAVDAKGGAFWENLKEHAWFPSLYSCLCKQGPVYFISAPSRSPNCLWGKQRWLQNRLGTDFTNYIFTQHKHLFAAPGRILIDDSEKNVQEWREAGGTALLFPQPWNSAPAGSFVSPYTVTL
jgi:5'(3')-deoxyribonucleotidase